MLASSTPALIVSLRNFRYGDVELQRKKVARDGTASLKGELIGARQKLPTKILTTVQ